MAESHANNLALRNTHQIYSFTTHEHVYMMTCHYSHAHGDADGQATTLAQKYLYTYISTYLYEGALQCIHSFVEQWMLRTILHELTWPR